MSGIKTDTSGREVYNLDTSGTTAGGSTSDATAANQATQITAANLTNTNLGGVTETAPANDTASSGVNGRLQRIAQRLTSLIGQIPASLGAQTSAGSLSVVATSDGFAVGGNVASGASDAGNPVKAGGKYNSTLPTLTDGQRGDIQVGSRGSINVQLKVADGSGSISSTSTPADGASNSTTTLNSSGYLMNYNGTTWDRMRGDTAGLLTQQFALTGSRWSYAAAAGGITNTTTAVTIAAAAGSGVRNYLTGLQIFSDTLGTATEIAIRDGAAGTVLWRGKINTGGAFVGAEVKFTCPLKGTANTLMEFVTLTASGTGSVYVNAQGYTAA